jgi:hypothetical protein
MAHATDKGASAGGKGQGEPRFSLLGGPLYRAGQRLHLVAADGSSVRLGLALGLFA